MMPRDNTLVGTHTSRSESPEIEMLYQEAIGSALVVLLNEKGLYQNIDLDLAEANKFLSQKNSDSIVFREELSQRPWVPVTPGLTKDNHMRTEFFCGIGDSPLRASSSELKLSFPLPAFKCYCSNCKDYHTHLSVGVLWADGFLNHYPKISASTEQLFNFHYLCSICKDNLIAFLVKRKGLRMTLCGRTQRLQIDAPEVIPKKLRNIITEAISASNENDVYAGFYHLRTFCEHYMKFCIDIDIQERMSGEDLSAKYKIQP